MENGGGNGPPMRGGFRGRGGGFSGMAYFFFVVISIDLNSEDIS